MDEFKKIELNSSVDESPIESNSSPKQSSYSPVGLFKKLGVVGIIIVVLLVIIVFAVLLPAQKTYSSALATYKQAKITWEALKKQDVTKASEELAKTKQSLSVTQKNLSSLSYLRFVPIVALYYSDADHLSRATSHGLDAATVVVDSIKPYADVLGLKGQGSFVMGSAEDRIRVAVMTTGKITPRIDDVSKNLLLAKQEIDGVSPSHYPSFLALGRVQTQLKNLKTIADEGVVFIDQARPLIKVLPSLLGESKEKRYLVLFQNDKEIRPTGGFITAYAIFRIDKGIIYVDRSDDIYNLDNSISNKPKAPDPILKYLPKVPLFNLRDTNLSADFIESMQTFTTIYDKASEKVKVDGIIAIDTHVLVSTIKILDDQVEAAGIKFTTKNDKRCDCPQVIYVLEDNITRPVNYEKGGGRKDLLGSLLYAIMQKSLKSSPKLYWGNLVQNFFTQTNEKHVLFDLFDKNAQGGVEALNAAGRIKPFDGDYLHINEANFGGAKSNLFTSEAVTQDIQVAADGSITKTITINYKNPYPPSNCDLEAGGLCLNATLRDWIRVYVPKGSKLLDSSGSEVKVTTSEDIGKTVFEGFLTVRPKGSAVYTLKYQLPFKLDRKSPLPFLIQKQPGTDGFEYTIKVNGGQREKFELKTDKELRLSI